MSDPNVRVRITGKNSAGPAVQEAKSELLSLNEVCAKVGSALKAIAGLYIAHQLLELAKSAIDAADDMSHLSQKTGIAVEELSGLTAIARMSGTDVEGFQKSLRRLAMTLSDAAAGQVLARDTMKSIGVEVRNAQGRTISLTEALIAISGRFAQLKDGTEKAAAAMRVFGRTGMDMIPFLNEGPEALRGMLDDLKRLGIIMSTEDATAAREFKDQIELLQMAGEAQIRNIVMGLLPALMNLATAFTELIGGMDGARQLGEELGWTIKALATFFLAVGTDIEWVGAKLMTFTEAMGRLATADFSGAYETFKEFFGAVNDSFSEAANEHWRKGYEAIWANHKPITLPRIGAGEITRPDVDADQSAKQRMLNQMAMEKLAADFSKSINDLQLKQLEEQYRLMLIPVQEYFTKKKKLEEDSLNAELWATQQELKAQRDWAKAAPKEPDRIAAQQKINELTERETVLRAQLNAMQNKDLGGEVDPMLKRVEDMQRAAEEAQRVGQEIDHVYADLSLAEQRVQLQVETYKLTGTEAETQLNTLRAEAANKVAAITERYLELAQASGDPKLVQNASEMQLKLEQLRVKANQVRDAFAQGAAGGVQSFLETLRQTGDAEKSFVAFCDNLIAAIERVIEQMIAMALVQKALGFASGIFGGAAGSASIAPSVSAGGGGAMMDTGSMFDISSVPLLAGGGTVAARQAVIVGDQGPELWVPDNSGRIIPNDVLAGGGGKPQANVQLTVVNQGAPKQAQASQPQWNEQMKQWHIQLHLDDMSNNGPLSRGMVGAF
jgi:hypothetical protein